MTYKDIKEAQEQLTFLSAQYEEQMVENGGEVTEETDTLAAQAIAIEDLLAGEGIDTLGRIVKAKEDEIKTLKAEKDTIARKIKSVEKSIDFFKSAITDIMHRTGQTKAKGLLYGFTATTSRTTTVDTEKLNEWYLADIEQALAEIGIPNWVTIKLGAKVSEVPEGTELPAVFQVEEKDTVRFTKPRANKE